jgi:cytoskeletal protein RodZ
MSDDVLELARRVWPAAQPSQEDVDAAVRRLRRRLRRRRSRPRRVVSVAVAIVVGCISAVAWAAASAWLAPALPHPPLPPAAPALRAAAAAALTRVTDDAADTADAPKKPRSLATPGQAAKLTHRVPATAPATPAPAAASATAQPPTAAPAPAAAPATAQPPAAAPAPAEPAAEPGSAWKQVGDALAQGDERRASKLLQDLTKDDDAETRAKAALGLAQLAASRGDCARARSLATAVIGSAASPALTRRARVLMRECGF